MAAAWFSIFRLKAFVNREERRLSICMLKFWVGIAHNGVAFTADALSGAAALLAFGRFAV